MEEEIVLNEYEYAKMIFELTENGQPVLWTSSKEDFEFAVKQFSGDWFDLYQQWVESPSNGSDESRAKRIAKQNIQTYNPGSAAPNRVDVAQNNYRPISVPESTPIKPIDTIASTTNTIREMTSFRQAQDEYERNIRRPIVAPEGGDFLQSLVLALVTSNSANSSQKDDPLVVLKQLELTERANERSRQDQQNMLQMMQSNSDRNMQMMFELMRGNGNRSSIEEQILTKAVNNMLDPQTEDRGASTLWQDISDSGVLEKFSQGIGAVLSSRQQVPAGANPYARQEESFEQQNMIQYANMQHPVEQTVHSPQTVAAEQTFEPSFDEKCSVVFQKCQELTLTNPESVGITATSEQWNAILSNAVSVAVQRGEFNFPGNLENQLSQAIGELNIVLNARRLGSLLDQVKGGVIGIDQISTVAQGNPLFQMVKQLGPEGVFSLMQDYANIDSPGIKIIGWDIEHIISPDNRPIIEQVLSAVN